MGELVMDMDMSRDRSMRLPEGKSCADCGHFRRCLMLIGPKYINAEAHHCDWAPSRFVQAVGKPAVTR